MSNKGVAFCFYPSGLYYIFSMPIVCMLWKIQKCRKQLQIYHITWFSRLRWQKKKNNKVQRMKMNLLTNILTEIFNLLCMKTKKKKKTRWCCGVSHSRNSAKSIGIAYIDFTTNRTQFQTKVLKTFCCTSLFRHI